MAPAAITQVRISEVPATSRDDGIEERMPSSCCSSAAMKSASNFSSITKWLRPPDASSATRASPGSASINSRSALPNCRQRRARGGDRIAGLLILGPLAQIEKMQGRVGRIRHVDQEGRLIVVQDVLMLIVADHDQRIRPPSIELIAQRRQRLIAAFLLGELGLRGELGGNLRLGMKRPLGAGRQFGPLQRRHDQLRRMRGRQAANDAPHVIVSYRLPESAALARPAVASDPACASGSPFFVRSAAWSAVLPTL